MRKWTTVPSLVLVFTLIILVFGGFFSTEESKIASQERPFSNLAVELPKEENSEQSNLAQNPKTRIKGELEEGILVTRVIDGDTIEIEGGLKIRYIGIDTPETVHPTKGVECFGRQASEKNRALVEGKKVTLEKDISETDKYSRLLRYVYVGNKFVNEILVREGFASSSPYPPDIKHQERFRKAQEKARKENKGLWGACGAIAGEKITLPSGGCLIKGNISSSGEKIYHMPRQRYYNKTVISENGGERWFCSEEEAQKAGWRRSKL